MRGQIFLEQIDAWVSQQDADVNPDVAGGGRMHAGVGVFYFMESLDSDETAVNS